MIETGRNNIEKLANLTRHLKTISDQYDTLMYEIATRLDEIDQLNKDIKDVLNHNELIGAKKVAQFDARVRSSFKSLVNDDSAEVLRTLLEDAKLNLDDLTVYYKQHYLQTVAKQEEQLRKR